MWLLVRNGRDGRDLTHVLPDLAALAQFSAELARRMGDAGVDGPCGTLALHRRLRGALSGFTGPQIEQLLEELDAIEAWLRGLARRLQDLERVKRAIESGGPG